jgi:hypothetical protein
MGLNAKVLSSRKQREKEDGIGETLYLFRIKLTPGGNRTRDLGRRSHVVYQALSVRQKCVLLFTTSPVIYLVWRLRCRGKQPYKRWVKLLRISTPIYRSFTKYGHFYFLNNIMFCFHWRENFVK